MKDVKIEGVLNVNEVSSISATAEVARIGLVLDVESQQVYSINVGPREVDEINVNFGELVGAGETGNIQIWIHLLAGVEFISPILTTKRNQKGSTKLESINFQTNDSNTALVLSFNKPSDNTEVDYKELFFHTTAGIIDPSIRIRPKIPPLLS